MNLQNPDKQRKLAELCADQLLNDQMRADYQRRIEEATDDGIKDILNKLKRILPYCEKLEERM